MVVQVSRLDFPLQRYEQKYSIVLRELFLIIIISNVHINCQMSYGHSTEQNYLVLDIHQMVEQ